MRRQAWGRGLLLGSLALGSSWGRAAQVGEAQIHVARSADALSCPDDEMLAIRVRQLHEGKAEVPLRIDVQIDHPPSGYRARIRVNGPRHGERELFTEEETCAGLADALTVSLALLLGEEAPAPLPPLPSSAPPEPPPPPEMARPEPLPGYLQLALHGGVAFGLPQTRPGATLSPSLRLASRRLPGSVGARFSWSPQQERSFAAGQVNLSLWRVHVEGCWRPLERASWELNTCGGLALGHLRAEGRGFSPDRTATRPYRALEAALVPEGSLVSRWRWSARAALLVPLHGERFVVDGVGVAAELPAVGGELLLGLGHAF
jgi:hypothetical protein